LALLAVLATAPRDGAAASESLDEIERWVPALSLSFDALGQKARGSVTSGDVLGPPLPEGCLMIDGTFNQNLCPIAPRTNPNTTPRPVVPRKIQPDDEGADTNVVPLVVASLELMTPRLFEPLLQPRLFVHADAAAAFGFERNLAGDRAPAEFGAPSENFDPRGDVQEEAVVGQGTRTKLQVRPWVFSGGAGVAFSFRAFGRSLRIKPSFEYLREEIDLIGTVRRAVKLAERSTPPPTELKPSEFRLLALEFTAKKTLHGLGPGLEIEADTANIGPFLLSVFLMGRGYYLQGNHDFSFTEINEFGETATWTAELDPWTWRSGVGVRFRWVPQ
jgi:hypothetical protein